MDVMGQGHPGHTTETPQDGAPRGWGHPGDTRGTPWAKANGMGTPWGQYRTGTPSRHHGDTMRTGQPWDGDTLVTLQDRALMGWGHQGTGHS